MNRAGRVLLVAAVLLAGCVCFSLADDAVSLSGISASRQGETAVIELHTTGAPGFRIDHFTLGNWLTVWSQGFLAGNGVTEIPLSFDRPELADIVTAASLVNENRRSGVRLYLGPRADKRGAFLLPDGDVTRVYIPALAELAAAGPDAAGSATADAAPAEAPAAAGDAAPEAASSDATQAPPAEASSDAVQAAPEPAPDAEAGSQPTEVLSPVAPSAEDLAQVADAVRSAVGRDSSAEAKGSTAADNTMSFFIPRHTDGQAVVPASQNKPLTADAQVSYQVAPEQQGGGGAGQAPPESTEPPPATTPEELKQQAERMSEGVQKGGASAEKPMAPSGLRTPAGSFYSPRQAQADVTSGAPETGAAPASGKDALSAIRINLFEILGTPLDQALTLLVAPTDYNIIVDSSVGENTVSLSFKEGRTDLKSALDLLTRTYGLEYIVQSGTIVVAAKDKINGQLVDFQTRVFVLSYADPKSVKDILVNTQQLSKDQVEIYQGEQTYPAVSDSTQLSQVSAGGGGGDGGGGGGGGGGQIKQIQTNLSSSPRNALLVKAVPSQMEQIAQVIAILDRKPKLIELEVRVCEAQERALKNLGISVQSNETGTPTGINSTWTEQANEASKFEAFSVGSFQRSPLAFLATLNSQIQDRSVSVLAQPTLSTVEGKQAIYFAGESVPYISRVTTTNTGTQVEVSFLNIGVTLNFKPRLDADGKLTIDVNPIVSSLLEFRQIGQLMEAPRTSERQLATTVRVADQEPFVLAGLISEDERKTVTKVPLLGDMPLVGKLFRNTNRDGQRTEIIIVVVPHIHD